MEKEILSILKDMNGSVLVIGFDDENKIISTLDKNKNVTTFYTLVNTSRRGSKRKKVFDNNGKKIVNIKKLRKYFKKAKFDYLVCEFETIKPYLRSFLLNSSKLTNKLIYYYLDERLIESEELEYRYKRYGAKCNKIGNNGKYLITIDNSNVKMPWYKRTIYAVRDIAYDTIEFIALLLTS